ncbi:MAG TPA: potassium-transporting ATPase subunit KdpC [Dehalococcoidia bacterium]|jgi:K+-transporting ATPase ATPase C chain
MVRQLKSAAIFLAVFTVITGIVYPLVVTGIAQVVFHHQANGSLIESNDGKYVGSELIGQPFDTAGYFWSRPSATTPFPYNAASSSGSNYGPLNPVLLDTVQNRIKVLKAADPDNSQPIPVDLVTCSASGLDPHISVAAALYQVPRVARERGLSESQVTALVNRFTQGRQLGIFGEPRVNVLLLNQALGQMK